MNTTQLNTYGIVVDDWKVPIVQKVFLQNGYGKGETSYFGVGHTLIKIKCASLKASKRIMQLAVDEINKTSVPIDKTKKKAP